MNPDLYVAYSGRDMVLSGYLGNSVLHTGAPRSVYPSRAQEPQHPPYKRRHWAPGDRDQIRAAREQGESWEAIGKRYGVHPEAARRIVRKP